MVRTVLIIEDEEDIRLYLKKFFIDQSYNVAEFADGIQALSYLEEHTVDIVILDLGLPKLDGESVCKEIKQNYPELPLIILTAKDDISDVVRGFNLGADDYLTKPFRTEELLARVKARLKDTINNATQLTVADLVLDKQSFEVRRADKVIPLSHKEFELLEYLMANVGHVLSRDTILQRIWMGTDYIEPRVVDVYIGYLRKKIDQDFDKKLIQTMRGFGYVLKE